MSELEKTTTEKKVDTIITTVFAERMRNFNEKAKETLPEREKEIRALLKTPEAQEKFLEMVESYQEHAKKGRELPLELLKENQTLFDSGLDPKLQNALRENDIAKKRFFKAEEALLGKPEARVSGDLKGQLPFIVMEYDAKITEDKAMKALKGMTIGTDAEPLLQDLLGANANVIRLQNELKAAKEISIKAAKALKEKLPLESLPLDLQKPVESIIDHAVPQEAPSLPQQPLIITGGDKVNEPAAPKFPGGLGSRKIA